MFIYNLNQDICRQNANKRLQLPLYSPFYDKHFYNSNNTNQQSYMFVWLEAVKQYVFHIYALTSQETRWYKYGTGLVWFVPVYTGSIVKSNSVKQQQCFSIGVHYGSVMYWMMPFP